MRAPKKRVIAPRHDTRVREGRRGQCSNRRHSALFLFSVSLVTLLTIVVDVLEPPRADDCPMQLKEVKAMKLRQLLLLATVGSAGFVAASPGTSAQLVSNVDGSGPQTRVLTPQVAIGQVPRYVATYMASQTGPSPRSATVVSITNNSSSVCGTSVDWKVGFGSVSCTTTLSLAPGQTGEHCSRSLNSGLAVCNATCSPELTAIEGNATIGSSSGAPCAAMAVSARTFYTTGTSDQTLNGVSDTNLVRVGAGNNGD